MPEGGPALAFLSLGQVVPMVSFLRDAQRLRADLAYLGASDALTWVDVTAPGDGCAFALCDPVEVSGVAPEGQRWRFFRLHFQYMCSFDRPRDDDYFQITAGPQTLEARYRDRPASKSRITRAVNKFTDHTP